MLGYVLPGAAPSPAALQDSRMRRLANAGPWQVQPHAQGALVCWRSPTGPLSISSFGESRPTDDGLIYFPPKEIPLPDSLLRDRMNLRDDTHRLDIETGLGFVTLTILPAYATPRSVLDNNLLGKPATVYARKARAFMARLAPLDDDSMQMSTIADDLYDVCREAVMHTTRCTKELITDAGWLTEASVWQIWRAIIHVPKELSGPASAHSESKSSPKA